MHRTEINCLNCDAKIKAEIIYGDGLRFCPACDSTKIVTDTENYERVKAELKPKQEEPMAEENELIIGVDSAAPGTHDITSADYDRSLGTEVDCFGRDDNAGKMFRFEVKDAPEQGTDKWLEWRKQGITATEAGMIMFPDSHASPMTVYSDKLGLTTRDQSDPDGFMEWGHRIEDLLVHKFMETHPTFTDCTQGRLYQRDWCKCSLDAQAYDGDTPVIIECKTGQNEAKWNPIPDKYYAQVQWQMYVTGIRTAYFAVLIRGHQYFEKKVEYNPAFVEQMLHKCFVVWDSIQNKQPPARLGINAADKDAIAAMAGVSGHSGPAISVDAETIAKFKELKERAEKADEEFQAFKNELGYKMVDASRLLTPDGKSFASWVERKGTTGVDKKLLQTKYPDVYNECMKTGMPSRYVKYNV